jgi:hypothetical protein
VRKRRKVGKQGETVGNGGKSRAEEEEEGHAPVDDSERTGERLREREGEGEGRNSASLLQQSVDFPPEDEEGAMNENSDRKMTRGDVRRARSVSSGSSKRHTEEKKRKSDPFCRRFFVEQSPVLFETASNRSK